MQTLLIPLMFLSLTSCQEGKVTTTATKTVNTSEPYTFITDADEPITTPVITEPVTKFDPLRGYPDALSYNNQVSMPDPALDYLIMDVCVDESNFSIKGDPAVCPKHRNIRIGERIPYLISD